MEKNNNRLLTQKEVAKKFRVTENTIRNWRQAGLFSYLKVPGSTRIQYFEAEIEEFIQKNTKKRKGVVIKSVVSKGRSGVSSMNDWRIS